ncbi:MAG: cofactor-independent phosphoglycerate mutase [Planctomycetota bacterium]
MKYCIVIPDGMADYPVDELDGKTPLEAADTPNMDRVAERGRQGTLYTVPEGMDPGSDVAIMSVLGIDPATCYTGRAPLEAASMGIELGPRDTAFRCNLVTVDEETMIDYSAGHITTAEAAALIEAIGERLATEAIRFYPGVSYRHLMVYRGPEDVSAECTPPHDITGEPYKRYLPRGPGAELLRELMESSAEILEPHDVNAVRVDHDESPANMIWLWGSGKAPTLRTFKDRFGKTGAVISAVDLVKGIGTYLGFDVIEVEGATGYLDTNYAGKAEAAISAFGTHDLVVVHVEATDEAGHKGSVREKIQAIEDIDAKVLGPILDAMLDQTDFRILVTPDHPTPISERTHVAEPVPFAMCGTDVQPVHEMPFSEKTAADTGLRIEHGHELMAYFLRE